ncbi:MAG: hypothetical protein ACTSPQ_12255 [Candidatus Helarchaeota archaeon]
MKIEFIVGRMSFNFNELKLRIESESGLLFKFLKLPWNEVH